MGLTNTVKNTCATGCYVKQWTIFIVFHCHPTTATYLVCMVPWAALSANPAKWGVLDADTSTLVPQQLPELCRADLTTFAFTPLVWPNEVFHSLLCCLCDSFLTLNFAWQLLMVVLLGTPVSFQVWLHCKNSSQNTTILIRRISWKTGENGFAHFVIYEWTS